MNGDQHAAAGRLVARLRVGNAHLAPDHSPSWMVYGRVRRWHRLSGVLRPRLTEVRGRLTELVGNLVRADS